MIIVVGAILAENLITFLLASKVRLSAEAGASLVMLLAVELDIGSSVRKEEINIDTAAFDNNAVLIGYFTLRNELYTHFG